MTLLRHINPYRRSVHRLAILLVLLTCAACRTDPDQDVDRLFELLPSASTNVDFVNTLEYAYEFNIYRYRNFYNGGGVAIGDVNNDGWKDLFFVGNQTPNRLYLNNGDFSFADVTDEAGVAGRRAWSTGVSMADLNGDGWLDIYVCNSGIVEGDDKKNELYINNRDGTFTEMAEAYGLADGGLSIHGTFFDYDGDGDLDLYLVNNSYRNIDDFNLRDNTRHIRHQAGGDRLYRNELISQFASDMTANGHPRFVDVSREAGIYGSEIGFGLGVSAGDVNRDGWPDMYISNDFFERDYLYVNNGDGTFSERLEEGIGSVSAAAMGADMADLNGDGYPEIFVTDMLPKDERRLKTVSAFDTWERYQNYIRDDYYHQFTRNTLQLNRGPFRPASYESDDGGVPAVHFSEIGRFAGVEASDWSWGAMIADFDLDGVRDLFVANGIYQDLTNADYLVEIRDEETMSRLIGENYVDFETLIDMIPSNPIANHMFRGHRDLRFEEVTNPWGLSQPAFSNGSAYGDLDNDGDLDLVINNVNMEAFVYRSRAREMTPERGWLQVDLAGPPPNRFATGAQVTAWVNGHQWYVEQQPVRGFQSTVDHTLHFGFGTDVATGRLDSLVIRWPNGRITRRAGVPIGQKLTVEYDEGGSTGRGIVPASFGEVRAAPSDEERRAASSDEFTAPKLTGVDPAQIGLGWRHVENEYSDFDRQPLLFHMRSTEGPPVCAGDANGDGLEDLYVGGAKDQPGVLFMQSTAGRFAESAQPALQRDAVSEDTDCVWFDADGDGHLDLFVASGGSEFPASSSALMDRLYINDGAGNLTRSDQVLTSAMAGFEPTGAAAAADFDGDGDVDLFLGTRMRPFAFGVPVDGHLLLNDGSGRFTEVTDTYAPELRGLGMITDAKWGDVDGDGALDLVIAGEWMPLTVFAGREGHFVNVTDELGLSGTGGWWNAVELVDLDGDGDLDLLGGNHGLNSRFRASGDAPLQLWVDDFDGNGSTDQVLGIDREGDTYPMNLRHDLVDQIPWLEERFPTYADYAGATVQDVFTEAELSGAVHHRAVMLESVVGWNDGGRFRVEALPFEAQLSPMYAIAFLDGKGDGERTILMGGNLNEAKPEVGRYDASYGVALTAGPSGIGELAFEESGFWITGAVRDLERVDAGGRSLVVVTRNNDSLAVFSHGD